MELEFLKKFKKGAMIKWTHSIQALAKMDPLEPDLNEWNVLEEDAGYNAELGKIYLFIKGWSIPFGAKNAVEGFTVLEPTDLSGVLFDKQKDEQ